MVQFECPKARNPYVSFTFDEFMFPFFCPCSFLPSSPCSVKKWFIMGLGKKMDFFGTKSV